MAKLLLLLLLVVMVFLFLNNSKGQPGVSSPQISTETTLIATEMTMTTTLVAGEFDSSFYRFLCNPQGLFQKTSVRSHKINHFWSSWWQHSLLHQLLTSRAEGKQTYSSHQNPGQQTQQRPDLFALVITSGLSGKSDSPRGSFPSTVLGNRSWSFI